MNGKLIISLDFELIWGMLDSHTPDSYRENVEGVRVVLPALLDLFRKYNVHATFATVGMIFADSPEEAEQYMPVEELLPTYEDPALSTYPWLEKIKKTTEDKGMFFAPELISAISETPGMEIGSHTFSHYYCRETGQTPEQFEADIEAAVLIASDKGFKLTSMVLPRNQSENEYVRILAKHGFTAYRNEERDWIHTKIRNRSLLRLLRLMDVYFPLTGQGGYHPQKEEGLWDLTGSRMYKPYFGKLAFLENLKLHRIKRQMKHAAKNGLYFHLWWHPHNIGIKTELHLKQLESVLQYYSTLRDKYGMQSVNMREAAEELTKTETV